MTPDEPDIDFKLDGIGNSFMEGVGVSIYHLLGVYLLLSHSTEPVQGQGLEALLISINVLWSTEQPALTSKFHRSFSLRNPLDSFLHSIGGSCQPDIWLNSSLKSWFTTLGVVPPLRPIFFFS